ncbi:carboxypeptidase-like regulatory domain-containing protein [uncultured Deinococcus sp.]|uniref:carboxypeptidase-like regulatory domain-containing protein n=1 Tax=uncultured Deinococcus sp. TaxID=158789 RepID=UPI0025E07976|nr:carboxypeptidase-like regulatory domain-containing protein [uncultured Deinococcus sp.]
MRHTLFTLTALLTSAALAAGPKSTLVEATFIDGAQVLTGSTDLKDFAGSVATVARAAGGTCAKSEYVAWESVAGLEGSFKSVLAQLGYTYTLLNKSTDGGYAAAFKLTKGQAVLSGVWAEGEGTTVLGWCAVKVAPAAAKAPAALTPSTSAKAPAALTPSAPARPAPAPAPATPVARTAAPAPTVRAPAARRGYVSGVALDTQGRPLPGAEVYLWGTTFAQGQRTDFRVQTKADGTYSIRVPDGRYRASAKVTRTLAGATFELPLHPASGSDSTEVDSSEGGTLNFRWRLSGSKPSGGKDWDDAYGASVNLSYCGLPASAYCDAKYAALAPGAAPAGSVVTLTFTPQGKLIDGTQGQAVTKTFNAAPLSPPGGYPYSNPDGGGRTVLGQGWPYQSQDFNDLPLGVYTLTATALTPDGRRVPLKLGLEQNDVDHGSVTLKWSAYDVTRGLKQLRVYVRD